MADEDRKEQRKAELFAKHGARGMRQGYELQGEYFLRTVDLLDELDADWTEAWLTYVYDYMYGRGVLDDKTRTLDRHRRVHRRRALRAAAQPHEHGDQGRCRSPRGARGVPAVGHLLRHAEHAAVRDRLPRDHGAARDLDLRPSPFEYTEDR